MITRANLGWKAVTVQSSNTDKGIILHYDGENTGLAAKSCIACRAYWQRTRLFHIQARGWADIGYAYGVCPHGEVYEGRGYGRIQAAARQTVGKLPNGNYHWVNVTFMSGPDERPTVSQLQAFYQLRQKLIAKGMGTVVKMHRDFTATDCPGDYLASLVRSGKLLKSGKGDNVRPEDFWYFEVPVSWATKENPEWRAISLLVDVNKHVRQLEAQVAKLEIMLEDLADRHGS